MSLEQFKWKKFSEERPYKVKTELNDDRNPYFGKFMVRLSDGQTVICSYTFPSDDDLEEDAWFPKWTLHDTCHEITAQDGDLWYPMDFVFCMLEGYPTPYACWEFGCALAEFAIPALDVWIRKGASYKAGMTPETWHEVLNKIKMAFEVSLSDMTGQTEDTDESLWKEHNRIRKEGFSLLAENYLDMWD